MITVVRIMVGVFLWCSVGGSEVAKAYEAVEGMQGATINGRIIFSGTVPPLDTRAVRRDATFCGDTITMTFLEVNAATQGVSHVVVSLEGIARGKAMQEKASTPLMNKACRFEPHTQVAARNATLEISSDDPVLHNTHLRMNDKTFLNIALPPTGRVIKKTLKKPGRLDVRCDAHKFMQSTIHVFPHPYFALTNGAGEFEMSNVPPGKYQLALWHEVLGAFQQPITVPLSGEKSLTIDLNELK